MEKHKFKIGDVVVRHVAGPRGNYKFIGENVTVIGVHYYYGDISINKGSPGAYWKAQYFELAKEAEMKQAKHEYKVGDRVRIIPYDGKERWIHFAPEMEKYAGKEVTITAPYLEYKDVYRLSDTNGYYWHTAWFEPIVEEFKRDRNGRLRDKKGHFVKEVAAVIPKVKPVAKEQEDLDGFFLDKFKEALGNRIGNCSYALMYEKDKHIRYQIQDVCHARLQCTYAYNDLIGNVTHAVLDVANHLQQIPKEQHESYRHFVKWMLNESPWAASFKTKNVDDAFRRGVLLDVNVQQSRVVCAAVALRGYSEFYARMPLYDRLVIDGVPNTVAYFIAISVTRNVDVGKEFTFKCDGSHTVFTRTMEFEDLKKFLVDGFHRNADEEAFKSKKDHYGIYSSIANWPDYGVNPRVVHSFEKEIEKLLNIKWGYNNPYLTYYQLMQIAQLFR